MNTLFDVITLDRLREGFLLIGLDWRYRYVNDAVLKQSRLPREALIGHTPMELFPGIEKTELFRNLEACMTERKSMQFESEFVFPDGVATWFDLHVESVPEGLFILSFDISERKKTEQEKRLYVSNLEKMLHMTSHIVRQPVANILGITNLLQSNGHSPETIAKSITYLRESAQSLDNFTRDLMRLLSEQKMQNEK